MVKPLRLAPWLGAGLTVVGGLSVSEPALLQAIQYSRPALEDGQFWRLLLGHMAHYSPSHLIWNGLACSVLAVVVERRQGSLALLTTVSLLLAVTSSGLYWLVPAMEFYGGLSALNYGLLTHLLASTASDSFASGRRRLALTALTGVAGLLLFCFYQALSGAALMPGSLPMSGVRVAWQAHLLAILAGCLPSACRFGRGLAVERRLAGAVAP